MQDGAVASLPFLVFFRFFRLPPLNTSHFKLETALNPSNSTLRNLPVRKTLRAARLFHRDRKESRNSAPAGTGNRRRQVCRRGEGVSPLRVAGIPRRRGGRLCPRSCVPRTVFPTRIPRISNRPPATATEPQIMSLRAKRGNLAGN